MSDLIPETPHIQNLITINPQNLLLILYTPRQDPTAKHIFYSFCLTPCRFINAAIQSSPLFSLFPKKRLWWELFCLFPEWALIVASLPTVILKIQIDVIIPLLILAKFLFICKTAYRPIFMSLQDFYHLSPVYPPLSSLVRSSSLFNPLPSSLSSASLAFQHCAFISLLSLSNLHRSISSYITSWK